MTHSPPELRQLLVAAGLAPRRDLGQNFVVDPNTVRRIAALSAVVAGDHVVEVGAGLGSLTLALAERGPRIVAVEVDHGLARVLRGVVAQTGLDDQVTVVEADAMTLEWGQILHAAPAWHLVANLPYNVATPLIADLLDTQPAITEMMVMVQREVGERLAAHPGDAAYGAVSVKVAYWATAEVVGLVPPTVFTPRPNVTSALVRITRRPPPPTPPAPLFELVRRAFGQRRKMLRRSLAGVVDAEQFGAAGIEPTRRPEDLDVAEWCRLTDVVLGTEPA